MLRISATLLQEFALYSTEDWYTEAMLNDCIKGVFKSTPEIQMGLAYHKLLERPQKNLEGLYERNGFRFAPEAIDSMLAKLDPGVFEVKLEKSMGVTREGEQVILVTKVDHIAGLHISEFKTTTDPFDAERYMGSYQWRTYVLVFEAEIFSYHVAVLERVDDRIKLRDLASMNVYPYSGLESDVTAMVRELVRYLRISKLDEFVRRQAKVTA